MHFPAPHCTTRMHCTARRVHPCCTRTRHSHHTSMITHGRPLPSPNTTPAAHITATLVHCTANLHCTALHCIYTDTTCTGCTASHCMGSTACTELHWYCIALHCTASHFICTGYCTACTALPTSTGHCTALHCFAPHNTQALHCTSRHRWLASRGRLVQSGDGAHALCSA